MGQLIHPLTALLSLTLITFLLTSIFLFTLLVCLHLIIRKKSSHFGTYQIATRQEKKKKKKDNKLYMTSHSQDIYYGGSEQCILILRPHHFLK